VEHGKTVVKLYSHIDVCQFSLAILKELSKNNMDMFGFKDFFIIFALKNISREYKFRSE